MNKIDDVIIDSIIDRLLIDELPIFINYLANKYNNKINYLF
jgi:hypothetical protein